MKKINIKRVEYYLRNRVLTINNIAIMVTFLVAVGWLFGSIGVLERNYGQQRKIDNLEKEHQLAKLETAMLEYQRNYYKSDEYKELAVRQRMGLALPGEKAIILPPNTELAKNIDEQGKTAGKSQNSEMSNQEQWLNFFFGDKSTLQDK